MRRWAWSAAAVITLAAGLWGARSFIAPAAEADAGPYASIRSIAVLPLENYSGNVEQEYFTRAMTEVLTAELARIRGLTVVSRTTAQTLGAGQLTADELAGALGVDAFIEGSVFRSGDQVRITAQLVAARPERHLWAESYEGGLGDAIRLQRDVARRVAATIASRLTEAPAPPTSAEAQDAYFLGISRQLDFSAASMTGAVDAFRQAVEIDPEFAEGWAKLAESYWLLTQPIQGMDSRDGMERARMAAERALSVDPTSGLATIVTGWVALFYDWDPEAAETAFRRALDDWPFLAPGHAGLAFALSVQERHEDAVSSAEQARDLEPLVLSFRTALAEIYWYAGRYEEGHRQMSRALAMDSTFVRALLVDRWIAETEGDWSTALRRFQEAYRVESGEELQIEPKPRSAEEYWTWRLRRLARPDVPDDPYAAAVAHAELGDLDASLVELERVKAVRDGSVVLVSVHPAWSQHRDDPRLVAFLGGLRGG